MKRVFKRQLPLHLMMLPGVILLFVFSYVPLVGVIIAFQDFMPALGFLSSKQAFAGLDNFRFIFAMPETADVFRNTLFIAGMKIVAGQAAAITVSLLLNEIRKKYYQRTIQTLIYLPYFLSWVILGDVFSRLLSQNGLVNNWIVTLGFRPVPFLSDAALFPYILVVTDVWKNFGYSTIVYLAALTSIDPGFYEAAIIDGAGRVRQTVHVTLPGMMPIIVLMALMSLGNILNAGFEQVFNMYSSSVMETGDIIDTLVYRMGLVQSQYSFATAIGLTKSVVTSVLISLSYYLAYRCAGYRIF